MKKLFLLLALACGQLAFSQATSTQQSASHLDACTPINANAAVNNAVTLTIPAPPNGQFIYIAELDMQVVNDATGAVTQAGVSFTSTNLNSWQFSYSSTNAANTSTSYGPFTYGSMGIKAAASGTKVTIVSPAANTHAFYNINACYWIGT